MVYGLIIHSLSGTVWFAQCFTPEGNDRFKKQRIHEVISAVCREHQFRTACSGGRASGRADFGVKDARRPAGGAEFAPGRATMTMSGKPIGGDKLEHRDELVTTATSAKVLLAAQDGLGAKEYFGHAAATAFGATHKANHAGSTDAANEVGGASGSRFSESLADRSVRKSAATHDQASFLCRPNVNSPSSSSTIARASQNAGVGGFFSVLSPSNSKRLHSRLPARLEANEGAREKLVLGGNSMHNRDAPSSLQASSTVSSFSSSSSSIPSVSSPTKTSFDYAACAIPSGEGVFRMPRSDVLGSPKTIVWRHVLNSVFVLICEPHVDNVLLASNFLSVYVTLLCKEFHDPFIAASPAQFLSSPDTILTLTNKLLPCGQLLFMHPSMADYVASDVFLQEDVEDYFEGNDPAESETTAN